MQRQIVLARSLEILRQILRSHLFLQVPTNCRNVAHPLDLAGLKSYLAKAKLCLTSIALREAGIENYHLAHLEVFL